METQFNDLVYYPDDISVIENEVFNYVVTVDKLDGEGNIVLINKTVYFKQKFTKIPEMITGCYLTTYKNQTELTLVNNFMISIAATTTIMGNWNDSGKFVSTTQVVDASLSLYESYLTDQSSVGIPSKATPQVLLSSGWSKRNLIPLNRVKQQTANYEFFELDKKKDSNIGIEIMIMAEMISPTFEINTSSIMDKNYDGFFKIKRNGSLIHSTATFSGVKDVPVSHSVVDVLAGITLNVGDIITAEMRMDEKGDKYFAQFFLESYA